MLEGIVFGAQAKRKYQEVAQLRKELEHDNQELQEKYQQKAMCAPPLSQDLGFNG